MAGFDTRKVKSMTMGQIAATFTDEAVFGRGTATATASAAVSAPASASVPSAGATGANEYHDWRDEEDRLHHDDQRHFQRSNEGHRLFSHENQGKHSRPSSARLSPPFKED